MGFFKKFFKKSFWIVFVIVFIAVTIVVGSHVFTIVQNSIMSNMGYDTVQVSEKPSEYAELNPSITKSGFLIENETWTGNILVEGNVIVPKGKTLTIEPGTVVMFSAKRDWGDYTWFRMDNYEEYPRSKLVVKGQLIAEGTPENLIVFTSNETYPEGGDWFGIIFKTDCSSKENSKIKYSIIEYGLKNIVTGYANGEFCPENPLLIENNIIRHANKNIECLEPTPGGPQLRANGIEVYGVPTIIRGNIIYDNFKGIGNGLNPTIENNIIAFHKQPCWGDAPGTAIRTSGNELFTDTEEGTIIRNNLFFNNIWGLEMDANPFVILKNNILLSNKSEGIVIFRTDNQTRPIIEYNDFFANGRNYAVSKTGSQQIEQALSPTNKKIDPQFKEEDFWNANFIFNANLKDIGDPKLRDRDGTTSDIGPSWDWSWVKAEMLTKK